MTEGHGQRREPHENIRQPMRGDRMEGERYEGVHHEYRGETRDTDGARIFLQPIAAPSIVGLYGLATAAFLIGANMARWFGTDLGDQQYVVPFALFFGGIAQLLAGMWAYRARDGLATAMHSLWGSFWIAYGTLFLLGASGAIQLPTALDKFVPLGHWFIPLGIITLTGAAIALRENLMLAVTLLSLGVASALSATAFLQGDDGWFRAGGYAFLVSAFFAWYTATGLMSESLTGREMPPLFDMRRKPEVVSGAREPGVIIGQ